MSNPMNPLQDSMARATRLTREGRLVEATSLIQSTLGNSTSASRFAGGFPPGAFGDVEGSENTADHPVNEPPHPTSPRQPPWQPEPSKSFLRRAPEPSRRSSNRHRFAPRSPVGVPGTTAPEPVEGYPASEPSGGRFIPRSYTGGAGRRTYKLYVPSGYAGQAVPLIVMLHGCTQDPDDFAAGTRMNTLAEEQTFLVAYPAQSQNANISKCWNWFKDADQRRGGGEPSIIAGITREICEEYGVAGGRVYVAGMSAGGAMAAILGATYPDLYAAVGVHSGLAPGAARDLPSAFTAMKGSGSAPRQDASAGQSDRTVPLIVFHGDRDTTVHPRNADHLLAHYRSTSDTAGVQDVVGKANPQATVRQGQVPGGYAYTRAARHDTDGRAVMERWTVHGLSHAWSGGSDSGSYTDPKGPDATVEMVRFFDQQEASHH